MESAVYVLCGLTALICSAILFRGCHRSCARLLLWCGLFFLALTLENAILFVDPTTLRQIDLSLWRNSVALVGVVLLLFGMVWETR